MRRRFHLCTWLTIERTGIHKPIIREPPGTTNTTRGTSPPRALTLDKSWVQAEAATLPPRPEQPLILKIRLPRSHTHTHKQDATEADATSVWTFAHLLTLACHFDQTVHCVEVSRRAHVGYDTHAPWTRDPLPSYAPFNLSTQRRGGKDMCRRNIEKAKSCLRPKACRTTCGRSLVE